MAASLLLPSSSSSLPPSRSLLLPLPLSFCLLLLASASASSAHRLPRPFLDPAADEDLYTLDKRELDLIVGGGTDGYISSHPSSDDLLLAASTAANLSSSSRATARGLSAESSCDQPYGFLPCTTNVVGNLFLLAAYGYLLFTAAKLLSEGSELLLTVLDPGVIGGLLLPILGALPDSILILVSGLGGTREEAQEQVLVGIGLLAGSIVMLLTLLWGTCLFLGRCDLEKTDNGRLTAVDKKLTKKWNFTETGVETDELTKMSARIMTVSVIPFLVAQLPMLFRFSSSGNIPVLVACILALGGLAAYCLYQVFTPWIQQRRKEIAQKQVIKFLALEKLQKRTGLDQQLVTEKGDLNETVALELFKKIDRDNDNILSRGELQGMLSATFHSSDPAEDPLDFIMREFDVDASQQITQTEFIDGMRKWCRELKLQPQHSLKHHREQAQNYLEELQIVEEEEEEDAGESVPPSKAQIIRRAVFLLVVGTILAAVFADPLVDAVNDFSSASSIPSFFISFVLLPLASNSSEGVSSILFSARKKKKNMSLTYSQIYGGVTMNNTMGLGIFLAVVYFRGLVWDFSSEVLVVFLVTVFMGLVASFRSVFPAWIAYIALLLYPLSLGLVAVLDYVAGWE